eukprot:CAMPEP_0168162824 /NCGR_PEP_ID=MMETSP0139_2-20121125/36_1 /TAXON_ID=44445 /ORGANISM="Pseudo-nitzschia australis, Strain 10249 10 AB" /LENGTH=604 /DNA_ID=CAMNT_0008079653 /DNA_START=34 /DNA_END=1848 /DNA_ORIENTATION=-
MDPSLPLMMNQHEFSKPRSRYLLHPPSYLCYVGKLVVFFFLFWVNNYGVSSLALRMPPLVAKKKANAEISCSECKGPIYSLGLNTYRVPMALHELNRARLVQSMAKTLMGKEANSKSLPRGVILLEGGKQTTRYDTDHEPVFRQESYFHWMFGVPDPDVYGAISLPSGDATLFIPQYGLDYEIFCGSSPNLERTCSKYGVENVLPIDQLDDFIASALVPTDKKKDDAQLFLLSGLNTDSGNYAKPAHYDGIAKYDKKCNTESLFASMAETRVFKTKAEIELMRYTNWVSSMAHVEVMRSCQVGMMEYQLESLFQHYTYTHGGCRHMSYTCICACGPNPAILHYGHAGRPNDRELCDGDMTLLDMGAEYHCYASDITCSFPVNGKFTDSQLLVYNAVLSAQIDVIAAIRPGVSWTEMHRTAERAILKALIEGGLLSGEIDDMIDADLGAIFMPHGLGHLIGLDTHDVGGYMEEITPRRSERPGLKKLRTARTLEAGMVLTVEPGCYFIDVLLDLALANPAQAKYINAGRLNEFRGSGGVRLEDDIFVTEDWCENLTICPRAVSEVIDVMNGRPWPPEKDVLPELRRNWVRNNKGELIIHELNKSN